MHRELVTEVVLLALFIDVFVVVVVGRVFAEATKFSSTTSNIEQETAKVDLYIYCIALYSIEFLTHLILLAG